MSSGKSRLTPAQRNRQTMPQSAKYAVGIDLGTTNIVVAYCQLQPGASSELLALPQLIGPGQLVERSALPACRFHHDGTIPAAMRQLPWASEEAAIIGAWAQQLGQNSPERLLSSAKSWLSLTEQTPLPLCSDDGGVTTVSAVEASASYLRYLHQAWNSAFAAHPLDKQVVTVTVPASFDDGARMRTLDALHQAGLAHAQLIEEPVAAVYSNPVLDDTTSPSFERLLVVDIGGGTTDFSLIENQQGQLKRTAVGQHLMLGGDNMDLAVAARCLEKLQQPVTTANLSRMVPTARQAKEQLLAAEAQQSTAISWVGRQSQLIASAKSARLTQAEVAQLVVDGFFPLCAIDQSPRERRTALSYVGLPYPADAAITRHLAKFVSQNTEIKAPPDAVLLNGGPFACPAIRARLLAQLSEWFGEALTELEAPSFNHAVAFGAAIYGCKRHLHEALINSDVSRNYMVLVDGADTPQAVTLLSKGAETERWYTLEQPLFSVRAGNSCRFQLLFDDGNQHHSPGSILPLSAALHYLPPVAAHLPAQFEQRVQLQAQLSAVGVIELCLQGVENTHARLPLRISLRDHKASDSTSAHLRTALDKLQRALGKGKHASHALRRVLEDELGSRERWDAETARAIADQLLALQHRRRRDVETERAWFSLLGYCMRPGFGQQGDVARLTQLWTLYVDGVQYHKFADNHREWLNCWRRVAAGLDSEQQHHLLDDIGSYLIPKRGIDKAPTTEAAIRLCGALERIAPPIKAAIATHLLSFADYSSCSAAVGWAIARLAAGQLAYAADAYRMSESEVEPLLATLINHPAANAQFGYAGVSILICSGKARQQLKARYQPEVINLLRTTRAPQPWFDLLQQGQIEQSLLDIWGESLPIGLTLENGI